MVVTEWWPRASLMTEIEMLLSRAAVAQEWRATYRVRLPLMPSFAPNFFRW